MPPDEKEDPALAAVMERLRHEGEGILLIFDNATDADALRPYLPRGGAARALVTSNAPNWRGVAELVEIRLWAKEIGTDFLIVRTGRERERGAAEDLSEALGGLPLAHEQAAAYCERLEIPLAEYRRRFAAMPVQMLDTARDAPAEYHDKLTVAKTFALAIDEAGKLHPAAEPLIVHAAMLAPEPIPLFLFAEAREKFGEPLASALADDGLDEAVAALRTFALVDRETIIDERDPSISTDTIRLHRLVREVATVRRTGEAMGDARCSLVQALAAVYPQGISNAAKAWPQARRLDGLALGLVGRDPAPPKGSEELASYLLNQLAEYRHVALGAYPQARPLFERALAIQEEVFGPDHPQTAASLNNLALLLMDEGDFVASRPLFERALAIDEARFGPHHSDVGRDLNNLALLLMAQGDFASARPLFERALAIDEGNFGPNHPEIATELSNLAALLRAQGEFAAARPLLERALAIREKTPGADHPDTAKTLNGLALIFRDQSDLVAARPLCERALAIFEKALGVDHPDTAAGLSVLASVLQAQGDLTAARPRYERALAIFEKSFGPVHPRTATALNGLAGLLQAQGELAAARPLFERALAIREKALGSDHPDTAASLNNLGLLVQAQGDLAAARPLFERALAIYGKALGPGHPDTATSLSNLAQLLRAQGDLAAARPLYERALAIYEKALGPTIPMPRRCGEISRPCLSGIASAQTQTDDSLNRRGRA